MPVVDLHVVRAARFSHCSLSPKPNPTTRMEDSEFATSILTSTSPEDVANFLPQALAASSGLVQKRLVVWFTNYVNMLMKYNLDLNVLISNGREFFANSNDEFGSLDKIWNCVASCVMSQVSVNDSLIRVIKNDVIHPFSAVFKEDFKYSELLVNSEELIEMRLQINDSDGAYNWNVKAPAILTNLENFKRFEKNVLFNGFLAYMNTVNSKTSSMLNKNENAVNFILKEFDLDNEMQKYTQHMINTRAPPAAAPVHQETNPGPKRLSSHAASSRASINSSASATSNPTEPKKKSKLRSKMGSILGRKKKTSSLKTSDTIPEDESLASVPSAQHTTGARNSLYTALTYNRGSYAELNQVSPTKQAFAEKPRAVPEPQSAPEPKAKEEVPVAQSTHPAPEPAFPSMSLAPLEPSVKAAPNTSAPEGTLAASAPVGSPNVLKYSSSDEDSDVPQDVNGNKLGMLQAYNMEHPPKLDTDSDFRSRNTSSGKYSFEYGDEESSIANTPKQVPAVTEGTNVTARAPEAAQNIASSQIAEPVESVAASPAVFPPAASRPAPPPPPARKAHPVADVDGRKQEVASNDFRYLQSARDSFIQPQAEGKSFLQTQTTGNSMFKHKEYFKHFGDAEVSEGLNTSVAEILNVTFKSGAAIKSQVLGEIAFNYNSEKALESYNVRVPTKFSRFLLNEQVMKQVGEDAFSLNIQPITGRTLGGIKYMMELDQAFVPVIVKQVWKFEPHQASLIIKISLNPSYRTSISLENFVISAALDTSVTTSSASSKPEGSFNKDLNRITWRYSEPLVLSSSAPEEKLIARIMTSGQAKESINGVQTKFTVHNLPFSFVQILDSADNDVPSVRSLSSGNYSSHV